MNLRENFYKDGYLIIPKFIKNESFFKLSDELNLQIKKNR